MARARIILRKVWTAEQAFAFICAVPSKKSLKAAAAILGSARSKAKTRACRENGKKPKRKKSVYPRDAQKRKWMKAE